MRAAHVAPQNEREREEGTEMDTSISFFPAEPPRIPASVAGHFLNRGPFRLHGNNSATDLGDFSDIPRPGRPEGERARERTRTRSDPWDPMGSTGYRRPCVYVLARVYAGPWHGAQLGGPIPLTRSQHPSLAIIPLGGSLAKDLIKYCYTRNLIPLRTPTPRPAVRTPPLRRQGPPARPSCKTHRVGMRAIRRATR